MRRTGQSVKWQLNHAHLGKRHALPHGFLRLIRHSRQCLDFTQKMLVSGSGSFSLPFKPKHMLMWKSVLIEVK